MASQPRDPSPRFTEAFELHHRRVLAYALRRVDTPADAEDVVAETFAVAWRRVADLPAPPQALPWLLAIARRVAANQRRGRRRWAGLLDRLNRGAPPEATAVAPPVSPAAEALDRLRPDDRELLRLLAWDGLTQAEAAAVLGTSANAVAIRLHRARRWFAAELARIEKGSEPSRTQTVVEGMVPGRSARDQST